MNISIFVLICCGVFLIKAEGLFSLKRIKRTDVEATHIPKASDDFTSVKSRNLIRHESRESKKKGSNDHFDKHSKEMDHMYDKIMESFNATKDHAKAKEKAKGRKGASAKDNKKQRAEAVGSIATYILREQDNGANEVSHFNSPEKTINEIVMIDNSPKGANVVGIDDRANLRESGDTSDVHNNMGHSSSEHDTTSTDHDATSANHGVTGSAHVIIPQNKLAISRTNSPFEQMFRLANMFFYNLARDTVPIHTQSASLTLMPVNAMAQTEIMAEEPETFDYYYNTVESPGLGHHPALLASPTPTVSALPATDQSHTVLYGPPLVFKQPLSVNEPKNVLNVIENAIDTLMAGNTHNGDTEDEIELHCPIHHEKKSVLTKGDTSEHGDKSDDGIIHVCSCRLIKKKKKNVKKADLNHGDGRSLLHAAFI